MWLLCTKFYEYICEKLIILFPFSCTNKTPKESVFAQ